MTTSIFNKKVPRAFITRRLHSLLGLWLAIYLFEHLLINSQAALYFYDNGASFIAMVNKIHQMPYLKVIEITVLGLPFLLHGLWGISYLRTAKLNSFSTDGSTPALQGYSKNRAFSWQRITSWILLVGIIAHVVHMRFIENPQPITKGGETSYFLVQKESPTLYKMKDKLHLIFYDQSIIPDHPLKKGELLVESPSAGVAFLLVVRESFTNPLIVILYSILVISACYHGYNGLWTAMLTWGVVVSVAAQRRLRLVTLFLMLLIMSFGLFAAWGSYFL